VQHLAGAQEIADMLGVSRQRVTQLTARSDFPSPVAELAQGRVWETAAVREWARQTGRLADEDDEA
jgi:predicted DNA-binding transcriptional regulator AlpA